MEFNKQVANPLLIGAMELMKAEPTSEHNITLVNELLKAKFMSPATIIPEPEMDEEGNPKIVDGSQIRFSMVTTPGGESFIPAFTDQDEVNKWKKIRDQQRTEKDLESKTHLVVLTFDDYVNMLFNKAAGTGEKGIAGIAVNPLGNNLVLSRETVQAICKVREQAK